MTRAEKRRAYRKKWKRLFYNKYNKENYPHKTRQERKELAKESAKEEL